MMVVIRDSRSESDITMFIITDCSIPLDNRNSHEGKIKVSGRHANIDYLEWGLTYKGGSEEQQSFIVRRHKILGE
jgi:hypothetical protein